MTARIVKHGNASTVLRHPQLASIELCIANGISGPKIAAKYGLSYDAVKRYTKRMSPQKKALLQYRTGDSPIDLERLKQSESELVSQRNIVMLAETFQAWRLAVETGDSRAAIGYGNLHYKFNECQARLVGELNDADRHLHLSVGDSPQFRKLVSLVMAWTADKPSLGAELAAFLTEQEQEHDGPVIEGKVNGAAVTT